MMEVLKRFEEEAADDDLKFGDDDSDDDAEDGNLARRLAELDLGEWHFDWTKIMYFC